MHSNMYVLIGTPCVDMIVRGDEYLCVSVVGSSECACVRGLGDPCGTEGEAVGAAAPC